MALDIKVLNKQLLTISDLPYNIHQIIIIKVLNTAVYTNSFKQGRLYIQTVGPIGLQRGLYNGIIISHKIITNM